MLIENTDILSCHGKEHLLLQLQRFEAPQLVKDKGVYGRLCKVAVRQCCLCLLLHNQDTQATKREGLQDPDNWTFLFYK